MIETVFALDPWTVTAFMGASLLLYLTPGADMMFTIASGVAGGPRAGLAAAAGISAGVLGHVLMAAAGLAALVATTPVALDVIRYAGAAYLAWLAVQAFRVSGAASERTGSATLWRAFRRGFVTNILNPKVALFILAFLPQFTDPAIGPIWHQIVILGVLLAFGGVISDGFFGVFAGTMADRIRHHTRALNRLAGVIFGGLAVRLVVTP